MLTLDFEKDGRRAELLLNHRNPWQRRRISACRKSGSNPSFRRMMSHAIILWTADRPGALHAAFLKPALLDIVALGRHLAGFGPGQAVMP